MKNLFRDKVIIVTGASSGIGESIALEFAKYGSKVVLAARSEKKLSEIVKRINNDGLSAIYIKTDVSIEDDCKRLIDKTVDKYGTVDILINNAGLSMRASFLDVELKVLHQLMDVNFWGTVYCTKYALPYLIERKGSLEVYLQ
jgi:NADP-dependent 3-hydroxy acid dehydrogenase YdfG